MDVRLASAALSLALTVLFTCGAQAADLTPYFESSANQKPRGNAGVSVDSDRVRLKADLALRNADRTQVVPRLTSIVAINKWIGVETNVNLAEWNGRNEQLDHTFDTRLHFRSPAPFLDELEGRVWRSPDGRSGRILKFGFYQILRESDDLSPLTLRGQATVETTTPTALALASGAADGAEHRDNRRVGIETELAGLPASAGGRKSLRLKLEKTEGARPQSASSVAYDHAWTVGGFARVGFNVQMQRASYTPARGFEPSVGLTWRASF